jgi:O-methyltransferase
MVSASLRESIRDSWAWRVRPHVPRAAHRATALLLRGLGLEKRLLHWLIPACRRANFSNLSWATAEAVHAGLRRASQAGLDGDYYEFGLYRGFTFWFAQQAAAANGLAGMRFFGFDSFRGLPPPGGVDAVGAEFSQGDFACDRATVERLLSRFGTDWSRTHLIEGFYEASLTADVRARHGMRPVSVALIDCDLYSSAVRVLEFLEGLLQEGAILLFDDWSCFGASDDHGERRALREFLAAHPRWTVEPLFAFGGHGQAFVVHADTQRPNERLDARGE